MRPLISEFLTVAMLSGTAVAQTPDTLAGPTEQKATPAPGTAVGPPQTMTGGGDTKQPEPHIYRLGEHVSPLYGEFDVVDDWAQFKLKAPKEGQHWVRYEDNYLLVSNTDGLITEIVKAS